MRFVTQWQWLSLTDKKSKKTYQWKVYDFALNTNIAQKN